MAASSTVNSTRNTTLSTNPPLHPMCPSRQMRKVTRQIRPAQRAQVRHNSGRSRSASEPPVLRHSSRCSTPGPPGPIESPTRDQQPRSPASRRCTEPGSSATALADARRKRSRRPWVLRPEGTGSACTHRFAGPERTAAQVHRPACRKNRLAAIPTTGWHHPEQERCPPP